MKKHFNKKLVMTKKDVEDVTKSTKCWIRDNVYVNGDVEVSDHCHITKKYRRSAHRNCNINVKLTRKIPAVFTIPILLCKNLANSILK